MKRANPKKRKQQQKRDAHVPEDVEIRKIMQANKVGTAISLYYLHAEYGWGKNKRLPEFFNKFIENMSYCHSLSQKYASAGAVWNSMSLLSRLQAYTDFNVWGVIPIRDTYSREAYQLVFTAYLKTVIDYEFSRQKINDFVEAWTALLYEVMSSKIRFTGKDMITWCQQETRVDVDSMMSWD